jgi:general secretion pathway protein I
MTYRRPARPAARPGLSLMEVLVALAIFLFAMIALGQLIGYGSDRAADVRDLNRAPLLAQSKMAEVAGGAVALSSAPETPFEGDDADWSWSLDASSDGGIQNLWRVTVTVSRNRPGNDRFEYKLSQMVLDPSARGSQASGTTSSDTNGTGSTGGTTSGTTSGGK